MKTMDIFVDLNWVVNVLCVDNDIYIDLGLFNCAHRFPTAAEWQLTKMQVPSLHVAVSDDA